MSDTALRLRRLTLPLFGSLVLLFAFSSSAEAATKYWIGSTVGNFNDATRWSTISGGTNDATVPGSSDVATFDGGGTGLCTITADPNLAGIDIKATYPLTSVISVNNGVNVTVGTSGFSQAGGTFSAPAGTMTLSGNFTVSGGVFDHNTGTLRFTYWGGTIDVPISLTVNHLTLAGWGPGSNWTIAAGDTLVVNGTLALEDGGLVAGGGTGRVNAKGPVTVLGPDSEAIGSVLIDGTVNQSFTIPDGVKMPGLTLNNPLTTISFAPDANVLLTSLTLQAGTVVASTGTLTFHGNLTISGGTFTHNGGTLRFTRWGGTIDVPISLTVNHLTLAGWGPGSNWTIAAGDTLVVNGMLVLEGGGLLGGTLDLKNNLQIAATFDGAAGTQTQITFTGSTDQTYTNNGGATPGGMFTINKPAASKVILNSNMTLGASQNMTLSSGTLGLAGYSLTVNQLIASPGTTILAPGAGRPITIASYLNSGGSIVYTGNAADAPVTIQGGGSIGTFYGSVTLDNPGTTFTLAGGCAVNGDLTITAGSTLDVSTSNYAINGGNWVNNGTFVPRAGTVTLGGTLTGSTTFYNLTKNTANATLTLSAGSTFTVQNNLNLQGGVGQPLYLVSSLPGTQARLTLLPAGTHSLYFLSVKDIDASGGQLLTAYDSNNLGNNTNWSFQPLDLSTGLVGYWKLDNNATDSASTNNGTVSGATFVTTPAPTTYLSTNTHAASFNGASSISVADAPSLDPTAISIAAWVNIPSAPTVFGNIVSKGDNSGYRFRINNNQTVSFFDRGATNSVTTFGAVPLNTWTHIVVTGGPAYLAIFVNGSAWRRNAIAYGAPDTTSTLKIGAEPAFGEYFNGWIDDVRLYNRVLTNREIAKLGSQRGNAVLTLRNATTGDTAYVKSTAVTAKLDSLDASDTAYRLSNSSTFSGGTTAITARPTTDNIAWMLPSGDGEKIIYAEITRGSTTYTISDLITLDTVPPAAPTGLTLTAGADGTSITANVTAPATADVNQLIFRYIAVDGNTGSPTYPADSTAGTVFGTGSVATTPSSPQALTASNLAVFKTYGVRVWAQDTAGNLSAPVQQYVYLGPQSPRLAITAPNSAVSAVAGSPLTLTITAKDATGATQTGYAGPYTLTWTPSGGSATTLVSSASAFSNGATTATVTIGGSSAGPGTFSAVDNSSNNLTTGTLGFTFYPASFAVATTSTSLTAAEPFALTVTAKDAAGATVTRYSGTANLTVVYTNPATGARQLSLNAILPANFVSGVATLNPHYPDAGSIQVMARDITYVPGVTITGSSSTLLVRPKTFSVGLVGLPPNLTRPYVNMPFRVEVKALGADGVVTPNYAGTITVTGEEGLSTNTVTKTFVPNTEHGIALVQGLQASVPGTGVVKVTEGPVSGKTATFGIRKATLVLNSVTGKPGTLTVSAYIRDAATNAPVNEDNSTRFTISLADDVGTSSARVSSTGPLTVMNGTMGFPITKDSEGSVTVNATVYGFAMPVQPALVTWSNSAGTSSTTTFQVLQFEQAPSTTTTYQPPSGSYTPPPGAFAPPEGMSSPSGYNATSFIAPPSFIAPNSFTGNFAPPEHAGTFTMGGTRYDASVTMGHTLVAPTMPGAFGFYALKHHPVPGEFSPVLFGPSSSMTPGFGPPPAALRSKMEGLAQSWKDAGKLNTKQFDVVMEGIQTGQKPAGADMAFTPEAGRAMHQEFEAMAPAWLAGPGARDEMAGPQMDPFMVFDPSSQGWHHDSLGFDGFFGEDDGSDSEEDDEEGEGLLPEE